jgi:hypothetical protein
VDGKATGREANLALILAERVANVAGIIAGIMSARGERAIFALSVRARVRVRARERNAV